MNYPLEDVPRLIIPRQLGHTFVTLVILVIPTITDSVVLVNHFAEHLIIKTKTN